MNWQLVVGLLLVGRIALVDAASVTMQVNATVIAVQCTAEQRARIRACATPEQQTSVGPYKTLVTIDAGAGQSSVVVPRQEILVDPTRQVVVKTLLYLSLIHI